MNASLKDRIEQMERAETASRKVLITEAVDEIIHSPNGLYRSFLGLLRQADQRIFEQVSRTLDPDTGMYQRSWFENIVLRQYATAHNREGKSYAYAVISTTGNIIELKDALKQQGIFMIGRAGEQEVQAAFDCSPAKFIEALASYGAGNTVSVGLARAAHGLRSTDLMQQANERLAEAKQSQTNYFPLN